MQCPNCLLENVQYDEYSSSCYCPDCGRMWTLKRKKEKCISTIGSIVLAPFLCIPIVNVFVLMLLQTVGVKKEFIKAYAGFVVIGFLTVILLGVLFINNASSIKSDLVERVHNRINELTEQVLIQTSVKEELEEIKESEEFLKSLIEEQVNIKSNTPEIKQEVDVNTDSVIRYIDLEYLDSTVIAGLKVKSLMNLYKDECQTILLQTKGIREKYGDGIYKPYLGIPSKCINLGESTDVFYMDFTRKTTVYNFDYSAMEDENGTPYFVEFDDFTKKKHVYYINEKSMFKVYIRQKDKELIIGFQEEYSE